MALALVKQFAVSSTTTAELELEIANVLALK
jgi:hypothetical protein